MKSDCERFDELAARVHSNDSLSNEELEFFIAHEEECHNPGHKAVTWSDDQVEPLAGKIMGRLARDL